MNKLYPIYMRGFIYTLFFLFFCLPVSVYSQFEKEEHINLSYWGEVKSADMDNDGDMDVVYFNYRRLQWRENLYGDASIFKTHIIFDFTSSIDEKIDLKDMDADGDVDIVMRDHIAVNENGIFTLLPITFPVASGIEEFHIVDVDNDDLPDIVASRTDHTFDDDFIFWQKNLGNLEFADDVVATNLEQFSMNGILAFTDVNGDGFADIIYSSLGSGFKAVLNDGSGKFYNGVLLSNESTPRAVDVFDYENDGDPDVVSSESNGDLVVLVNNGPLNYSVVHLLPFLVLVKEVQIADPDQDSQYELFVRRESQETLHFIAFDTAGNVSDPVLISEGYHFSDGLLHFAGADFNGDGLADVQYARNGKGGLGLLLNDGANNYGDPHILSQGFSLGQIVDIDQDGDLDMLGYHQQPIIGSSSSTIPRAVYWENNGLQEFRWRNIADSLTGTLAFDMDGDGDLDVAGLMGNYPDNDPSWVRNEGNGVYSNLIPLYQGDLIKFLTAHDFDEDGDLDILLKDDSRFKWLENKGSGIFEEHWSGIVSTFHAESFGEETITFDQKDMDGDGDTDFLFCSNEEIEWVENLGQGNYTAHPDLMPAIGETYARYFWEDMNSDHLPDLLSASSQGIFWSKNMGNGSFGDPMFITNQFAQNKYVHLSAYDIDTDGDHDILFIPSISTGGFGDIHVMWNFGDGTFAEPQEVLLNYYRFSNLTEEGRPILFEDLDQDGDEDLLVHPGNGLLAWAPNSLDNNLRVEGRTFIDENENDIFDAGELPLPGRKIEHLPSGHTYFTNSEGRFSFYGNYGNNSLTALPDELWENTSPGTLSFDLPQNTISSVDFGFRPAQAVLDISAVLVGYSARCDTEVPYWLVVQNDGTLPATGTAIFTPSSWSMVNSTVPPADSVVDEARYFHFEELEPGAQRPFKVNLQMPDFNLIGFDIITAGQVAAGDPVFNLTDSASVENIATLLCSYDPNDKLVEPKGLGEKGILEEAPPAFIYTIRFQNTGNDTAFTVVLRDRLDIGLDINSLRPLAASHPVAMFVSENGLLEAHFENILLPDSTASPIGSQGFFTYYIEPLPTLQVGAVVENAADIFFDSNPAIRTNTVTNILGYELAVEVGAVSNELCEGDSLSLQPMIVSTFDSVSVIWLKNDSVVFNGQMLVVQDSGLYKVCIDAYGIVVCDSVEIKILDKPEADFTFSQTDLSVQFESAALHADHYFWDFGDGNTSTDPDPEHVYSSLENRNVCLTVANDCGEHTFCQDLIFTGTKDIFRQVLKLELLPNPTDGIAHLLVEPKEGAGLVIGLFDLHGVKFWEKAQQVPGQVLTKVGLSTEEVPPGVYFIKIQLGEKIFWLRLVKV
ncbi:MAG: FG-GAP-like repeat-containing protein [Bacteroidota bacterium]